MMGLEPTTFCMASRRSSQLSYIRVARQYSDLSERLPGGVERLVDEAIGQLVVLPADGRVGHRA
jgi:3'-phosphoadenosine 5'-phosphosulfate (PAPS) 3'-phosphatase